MEYCTESTSRNLRIKLVTRIVEPRPAKIERIRGEIAAGSYETDHRLERVLDKLLLDLNLGPARSPCVSANSAANTPGGK